MKLENDALLLRVNQTSYSLRTSLLHPAMGTEDLQQVAQGESPSSVERANESKNEVGQIEFDASRGRNEKESERVGSSPASHSGPPGTASRIDLAPPLLLLV